MITGDHHNTAIAVAKDVGMVKPETDIMVIDSIPQTKAQSLLPLTSTANMLESLISVPSNKHRVQFSMSSFDRAGSSAPVVDSSASVTWDPLLVHRDGHGALPSRDLAPPEGQLQQPLMYQAASPSLGSVISSIDLESAAAAASANPANCKALAGGGASLPAAVSDATPACPHDATSGAKPITHGCPIGSAAAHPSASGGALGCVAVWGASGSTGNADAVHADSLEDHAPQPSPGAPWPVSPLAAARASVPPSNPDGCIHHPPAASEVNSDYVGQPSSSSAATLGELSFTRWSDHHSFTAAEAIVAMAEGRLQCAVTGSAFEQLLHHASLLMVDTVLQNAVLFARMRPHQKGQVMDLLSSRGLHHAFQGHSRHLPVSLQQ